jgi:hypothetical protein
MTIPEWLFTLVVLTGVVGSALLLLLLVGYFIYEFRSKQVW